VGEKGKEEETPAAGCASREEKKKRGRIEGVHCAGSNRNCVGGRKEKKKEIIPPHVRAKQMMGERRRGGEKKKKGEGGAEISKKRSSCWN